MEKFNTTSEEGNNEEKKPSALGGIVKKTLAATAAAGVAFSALKMNEASNEAEKFQQENPRESLERGLGQTFDILTLKNHEDMWKMPSKLKFYFRSNIHNENGVKWVQLLASPYTNISAVTANPAIIKFLEENPGEENAFIQKNEKGEMELVKENGEVVMTIE